MELKQVTKNDGIREPRVNGFYGRHFDNFLEFRRASRPEYEGLTAILLERLPKNAKEILDVGCGDGHIPALLMERISANFHLLDQSALAIEKARMRAPAAVEFIAEDVNSYLPTIPDRSFDAILAVNSLYGATLDRNFAERIMAKLIDGGVFILVLATGNSQFVDLQKKYWSSVHEDSDYKKNIFEDALRVFGGDWQIARMPLETGTLTTEQCERIAMFMLYADRLFEPVRELAGELHELGSITQEYGILCISRKRER
ncbi:MAG: methyltransferase domain-containing protein [Candidatus Burarchaeum sp.]|nr:class I SAM-dependent methyltransferase [Candidatus Burarchaeum sp.]MDO8340021.1 methyltransferase domain-containing protein [Candidatus Burarchaeum sp.]